MPSSRVHVGVDIGGSKIMAVALDPEASPSETLARVVEPTPNDASLLVDRVRHVIEVVRAETGGRLDAVGLGVAGYIDHTGIARHAPNLPCAVDVDLGEAITSATGVPVAVDNDANCAARAALVLDAPGSSSLVMVTLGTGIGGALVIDGAIVRGSRGFAGEPGHMIVDPDGPECVCGQRGCWERRASGSGLALLARDAVGEGRGSSILAASGAIDTITGPVVTALAAAGDREALAVMDRFSWWVALGLANIVQMVDPETIILGGGLASAGDLLLGPVRDHVAGLATVSVLGIPAIGITSVGSAAGAVGAAILAGGVPDDR